MWLIDAFGGRREVNKIRQWGVWYGVKWWQKKDKKTPLARALTIGLISVGLLDRELRLKKNVERPEAPLNNYVAEHVEFLEIVDKSLEVIEMDRNSVEILSSGLQLQKWRLQVAKALVESSPVGGVFLEPLAGDGVLSAVMTQEIGIKNYISYGGRVELVTAASPLAKFYNTNSACDLGEKIDVVLLFEKIPHIVDPLTELRCLYRVMKPGGAVLVAEPDASSSPAYSAALVALGAPHAVTKNEVMNFLKTTGFKLWREIDLPPYYTSIWRKPASLELSPVDRWME